MVFNVSNYSEICWLLDEEIELLFWRLDCTILLYPKSVCLTLKKRKKKKRRFASGSPNNINQTLLHLTNLFETSLLYIFNWGCVRCGNHTTPNAHNQQLEEDHIRNCYQINQGRFADGWLYRSSRRNGLPNVIFDNPLVLSVQPHSPIFYPPPKKKPVLPTRCNLDRYIPK